MNMIKGRAIKFGDNIDTDQIIPAQYLSMLKISDMTKYTFEYDDNFVANFTSGDICVGGDNFGCGSSREQAPAVLKYLGVSAIVAKDFARIFYRNCINLGIPVIGCKYTDEISNLDEISIDIEKGNLQDITTGKTYEIVPFPKFVQDVLNAGGIINYKRMGK